MYTRFITLLAIVLLLFCVSCRGGNSDLTPSTTKRWDSPDFKSLKFTSDGDYLAVKSGDFYQVYSHDLRLIDEFNPNTGDDEDKYFEIRAIEKAGQDGLRLYFAVFDAASPLDRENAWLREYDESGTMLMEAQINTGNGVRFGGLNIGSDGTFYITCDPAVQAVSANGTQLWYTVLSNASAYHFTGNDETVSFGHSFIKIVNSDGEATQSKLLTDLLPSRNSIEYPRILQDGGSPFIMLSREELFAFTPELELAWRFEDTVSEADRYFFDPLFHNGLLYFNIIEIAPYSSDEGNKYYLVALDPATGETELNVQLQTDDEISALGFDDSGNLTLTHRTGNVIDSLVKYDATGSLVSQLTLTQQGPCSGYMGGSTSGIWPVSARSIAYYQMVVEETEGRRDNMLVAVDLDGNVVGTVVSDKGRWVEVPPYTEPQ